MNKATGIATAIATALLLAGVASAYPLDAYEATGIRRLEEYRLISIGELEGRALPPGALLPTAAVDLRLPGYRDLQLPEPDAALGRAIAQLLGPDRDRYGIALLDFTDPSQPRYAELNGNMRQNVGSVGKLIAALGLFQALADTWPDPEDRLRILRQTIVTADAFAHWDEHTVHFFDVPTRLRLSRPIKDGDKASLYEYLDWMLSPSSNAAAGMVMREALLLRQFGREYPVAEDRIASFFAETPVKARTELFRRTFDEALARNGFDLEQLRQGSFFTAEGKKKVPGTGVSYATPRSLLTFALRMEQGLLVDEFSSRELKRLLYMTERRIRYASSPQLRDAAVYFKSGSLYSCQPEEGFRCGKYKGNVRNYMNSFAIVESPAGERRISYMVMLISNVLRKNSAVEHQTLGTRIEQMLQQMHSD